MKQYVSNKPRPVGLKNFVITTSSGLMIDFIVYQGSSTDLSEKDFGLGPSLVLRLTETIPRGSTLYFDRYFTSLPLILQLKRKGYFATGTVMANRIGQVPLKEDKILKARGDSDEVTASGVAAVKWRDTKAIILLSTSCGTLPPTTVQRWSKNESEYVDVSCPTIVKGYNANMGGVDLLDQYMEYYRTRLKTRKWTLKVILHMLDLAVVNSYLNSNAINSVQLSKWICWNLSLALERS